MFNILLIASIFGFVLTTLLFLKKSTQPRATFFLGSFYFLLSVYALQAYIIDGGHLALCSWFFLWPLMLYNLFAVTIYFYFITIIEDEFKWKNGYLLLFLPFILSVIDAGYIYLQPDGLYEEMLHNAMTDPKNRLHVSYWLLDLDQHMLIRHVWQLAALLFVMPKMLDFIKEGNADNLKVILNKWLLIFWLGLSLFAVFAIFYAVENMAGINIFDGGSIVPVILYLIMFSVGIVPIYFPTILSGFPKPEKTLQEDLVQTDTSTDLKFGLDEVGIKRKLDLLIQKELHLQQDFNVTNGAREMEMPGHHLSYFIKQHYGLSFSAYRNKLRMDHAAKLIRDGFLDSSTMEALAWECGFASRSSFSKAFKGATGLSPSEYEHSQER
ncbi:helix-turn-helix domain-containing protein [Arenibacter sp. F20364]|uniref:AraC family transcriptional regulator n=1 Tax=Arenibacter sp. F20364 TaxID=2926415 RepID=UPI001FF6A8FE|nr:helix-turn-helix domain-containing protein [Arenibacter sp. F20364]MCK0192634.1 helix-turn-helix domain-containing protein [Arenibacter sp. F20364]